MCSYHPLSYWVKCTLPRGSESSSNFLFLHMSRREPWEGEPEHSCRLQKPKLVKSSDGSVVGPRSVSTFYCCCLPFARQVGRS